MAHIVLDIVDRIVLLRMSHRHAVFASINTPHWLWQTTTKVRKMAMSMRYMILVTMFVAVLHTRQAASQTQFIYGLCNVNKYQNNTDFAASVDTVINKLASEAASKDGFSTYSYGGVNGLLQCRGDVSKKDCQKCSDAVASNIRSSCPNAIGARIQLEYCFLRYENYTYADTLDRTVVLALINTQNTSGIAGFNTTLQPLLASLAAEAPRSPKLFAASQAQLNSTVTIYALETCLRSISSDDCATCLAQAVEGINGCCSTQIGSQYYVVGCNVRFEIYPFLDTATPHRRLLM